MGENGEDIYFEIDKSMQFFDDETWNSAMDLVDENDVTIDSFEVEARNEGWYGQYTLLKIEGVVREYATTHRAEVHLNAGGQLLRISCSCKSSHNQMYYRVQTKCKHLAALIIKAYMDYVDSTYDGYTDSLGTNLLGNVVERQVHHLISQGETSQYCLKPVIEIRGKKLYLSFKVGETTLYIIKDLNQFIQRVEDKENHTYGKKLTMYHNIELFDDTSKVYYSFIAKYVHELRSWMELHDVRSHNFKEIPLLPNMLDAFLQIYPYTEIEFKDADAQQNYKGNLSVVHENPKIRMQLTTKKNKSNKPTAVVGKIHAGILSEGNQYYVQVAQQKLRISDKEYYMQMQPFCNSIINSEEEHFSIGKSIVNEFYNNVIPAISKYVTIEEKDVDDFKEKWVAENTVFFYVDVDDEKNIHVRGEVEMRGERYSLFDNVQANESSYEIELLKCRMLLERYPFLLNDDNSMVLFMEEENIFHFLSHELQALQSIGEVQISDRVQRMSTRRIFQVSIGVRLESDLLSLDIDSGDVELEELMKVLSSYRNKKKYHRLKDGSFIDFEEQDVQSLSDLLESAQVDLENMDESTFQVPSYRALYIDKLLRDSEHISYERNHALKKVSREFKSINEGDYQIPASLKKIIRGYQKTGYRYMRLLKDYGFNGILADDMGLGKTLQVICLLLSLKEEQDMQGPSLVVCPASLVYNWESEIQKFSPSLRVGVAAGSIKERRDVFDAMQSYDVIVTSYDLLKRDLMQYKNCKFYYQIIDEAQYIKNHGSQISKATKVIQAHHKLALTGTPIENRLSELWSIFDYLMPKFLYSYEEFKNTFEKNIVKFNDEESTLKLRKMVSPFIMRRLKSDVLKDLPAKIEEVMYAKMDSTQEQLYKASVVKLKQSLATQSSEEFSKNKIKVLSELTRLRQICCDPSLVFQDYDGESSKLEATMDLIQNAIAGGHKILLFSQFTSMFDIIERRLHKENIAFYKIVGSTPKEKRMQFVNDFNNNEIPLFLISLKAGGTGLNLTSADIVIHFDPWWNIAAQNQASDRAHRIGQKKVVSVYQMIMKDSVEEKILTMQASKKALADQIINGESNQLSSMSKEDFLSLLDS